MSALFASVVKQALITFERENCTSFRSNLSKLKQLVDQLTPKDLNIDPKLLHNDHFESHHENSAPVTYLEIFEHKSFTMSVFIMRNNYTMPLHDHAGYGLLRVISGSAQIQSFSLDQVITAEQQSMISLLPVSVEAMREVTPTSECSILTPTEFNIHEITAAGNGSAAFFDILSPPYESPTSVNGPKRCLFFKKLPFGPKPMNQTSGKRRVYLQRISVPNDYYCDRADYQPPEFLDDLTQLDTKIASEKMTS